ncbi:hypothetical protein GCM10017559_32590 [Streptosporangium longisporum]|uniref:Uncharacterized protein n=1 Tax=Streptosporangium longisporum TaxID=46187 RepID=A0ABP6KF57_9ACTN
MDRQVEGEARDDPVHSGQGFTRGGRGHLDLVTRLPLHPDQIGDLYLDPAQAWQVTVTDVEDPHRASVDPREIMPACP